MNYLLDVNVLLAWGYPAHVHHDRVSHWLRDVATARAESPLLATCAITELGFVRIASGKAAFAPDVTTARRDLRQLKASRQFIFLGEVLDADCLPDWVTKSAQTTDGYLLKLASAYGGWLATLDTRIPGAVLIPEQPDATPLMVKEPAAVYGYAA
jgi:predicted nucleic acid-binding protein